MNSYYQKLTKTGLLTKLVRNDCEFAHSFITLRMILSLRYVPTFQYSKGIDSDSSFHKVLILELILKTSRVYVEAGKEIETLPATVVVCRRVSTSSDDRTQDGSPTVKSDDGESRG